MKKTYIPNENTSETYNLYAGINSVHGGWIMETGGDPCTLSNLEDAQAAAEIATINKIISDPATIWENMNENDLEYIQEWLKIWHLSD